MRALLSRPVGHPAANYTVADVLVLFGAIFAAAVFLAVCGVLEIGAFAP